MIVYNITMKVTPAIEAAWLQWQQEEHIPEVMATGFFNNHRFYKLLEQDENEGVTYVVQYFADNMQAYQDYIDKHAPSLRVKAQEKWGNQFIAFRTLMQAVN